jgi:hypothetical protein
MRPRDSRQGLGARRLHRSFAIRGPDIASASGLSGNAEKRYHLHRIGVRRGKPAASKRRP